MEKPESLCIWLMPRTGQTEFCCDLSHIKCNHKCFLKYFFMGFELSNKTLFFQWNFSYRTPIPMPSNKVINK